MGIAGVVVWIGFAVLAYRVGRSRGRPALGLVLGVAGLIGFIVMHCWPPKLDMEDPDGYSL
jgi:hypothetical protein